jgi:hypothetical protein
LLQAETDLDEAQNTTGAILCHSVRKGKITMQNSARFQAQFFPWSNWGLNIRSELCEQKWITLKVNYSK